MSRCLASAEGELVLDLATGTGDSAKVILGNAASVVGLDISLNMLLLARKKISDAGYHVLSGSAYAIPVKSETFNAVTCAFGIRNMPETEKALKEICRVTQRGGRLVFLEFSMPEGLMRKPYAFYLRKVLPFIAGLFSSRAAYDYLGESIEKFYAPDEFARLILDAGFIRCEKRRLSLGCVYIYKAYKE
jgi:demethylmenaquinone methyltransferase/2-methoxy-6-polyprenyl-1,4-benzoquinol methylase